MRWLGVAAVLGLVTAAVVAGGAEREFGDAQVAELEGGVSLEQSTIVSVSSLEFGSTAEFRHLLANAEAETVFSEMAAHGAPGARLFGICGLKALGSKRLASVVSSAELDERQVWLHSGGCVIEGRTVREAVRDRRFWQICQAIVDKGVLK